MHVTTQINVTVSFSDCLSDCLLLNCHKTQYIPSIYKLILPSIILKERLGYESGLENFFLLVYGNFEVLGR